MYLTTQLVELGIPVVMAVNMMDVVKKNGDKIDIKELSRELGCEVVEISALKGHRHHGRCADAAVAGLHLHKDRIRQHTFRWPALSTPWRTSKRLAVHNMPEEQQRWYAIKVFERDDKVLRPAEYSQGRSGPCGE